MPQRADADDFVSAFLLQNTDRREQLTILTTLQGLPGLSVYARLRILLILLSTRFDFNPASHAYMPLDDWSKARDELKELLALLVEQNGRYQVGDVTVDDDADEDDEWKEKEPKGENGVVRIRGSVGALVERLDEEVRPPSTSRFLRSQL
jgi:translation initiation factor 3 subunit C